MGATQIQSVALLERFNWDVAVSGPGAGLKTKSVAWFKTVNDSFNIMTCVVTAVVGIQSSCGSWPLLFSRYR